MYSARRQQNLQTREHFFKLHATQLLQKNTSVKVFTFNYFRKLSVTLNCSIFSRASKNEANETYKRARVQ